MIIMDRPKVGVGVIVINDNKVLLGKRKGSHGEHTWSFPGGHLEYFEKVKDCALRELKEETGINGELIDDKPVIATNDFFKEDEKHYITLFIRVKTDEEPELKEPEKCEKWGWFDWDEFPDSLFKPIENLLKRDYDPFN